MAKDNLLSASRVKLYGRELSDVTLDTSNYPSVPSSSVIADNNFLYKQLKATGVSGGTPPSGNARLARIFAFSFEGSFCNLPKPAIFLVHGVGTDVAGAGAGSSPAQTGMDKSGVAARPFFWEADVQYWEYDKDDVSLRLDPVSGTLDEILIEAALSPTSRSALVSRSAMASRSALVSDSDVAMRHRLR